MAPRDPIPFPRPSVEFTGGLGRLHCACGHTITTDQLNAPIDCSQCGRSWQLRAELRLESYEPKRQSPLAD